MYTDIIYEILNGNATITVNRPEAKNAFSTLTQREVIDAIGRADADRCVCVVVLQGAGQTFCAGADIKELSDAVLENPLAIGQLLSLDKAFYDALRNVGKPVIAKIRGFAVGGGCLTALACDFRVTAEDARIGFPFVKIGLSGADGGATYHLPRLVGYGRATQLLLSGDLISGKDAARMGLATKAVPEANLDDAVNELADLLKTKSPYALRETKLALRRSLDLDVASEFHEEQRVTVAGLLGSDWVEGTDAFKERRAPQFEVR